MVDTITLGKYIKRSYVSLVIIGLIIVLVLGLVWWMIATDQVVMAGKTKAWFKAGQPADIVLSAIGFNQTGGSLLFNHPGNVTSDGTHVLLADRNNNRILIWNTLPTANVPPDVVLGQQDFTTNNPGTGLSNLNWPVSVAAAKGKVVVADTENDRLLIWDTFPTKPGQPADLEIKNPPSTAPRELAWPWAAWTDGKKLVVTSTAAGLVLIWNTFPTSAHQPADIILHAQNNFGTPRSIASDGKHLMIGDHNTRVNGGRGNFFWKTFPTKNDQPYDFFVAAPSQMATASTANAGQRVEAGSGEVIWGGMTTDGKLIGIADKLYIWNAFPVNDHDAADVTVSGAPGDKGYDFGGAQSGDGTGLMAANGKLYISLSNGNKIVGYHAIPTQMNQPPDFVLGSPTLNTNTLVTNYLISNGVPASNGTSLFVSSDFDRKLYVWKKLPHQSGAKPDLVYPYGGWDNELFGQTFAMAGGREVYVWETLPTTGQEPDVIFKERIGSIQLQDVRGVAIDKKYFYLADSQADKIYVFSGIPNQTSSPQFILRINEPYRLSSDGHYLVVSTTLDNDTGHVQIYTIADLSNTAKPTILDRRVVPTNLPQHAIVSDGHLFVADTGNNRVYAWRKIEDALAGKTYDAMVGESKVENSEPEIGKNKLFWPAGLAFDGKYLWVGEFKFGSRLLRFSPK